MITLSVNGRRHSLEVDAEVPLLWVLREHLRLTGTKYACGRGVCGACTVLLNGQPVRSCVTPAGEVQGREITTIEGMAPDHPVKQAWETAQAAQCGYCQPGFIMHTIGLWEAQPHASAAELAAGLNRHLCRCGTYPRIKAALAELTAGVQRPSLPASRWALQPEPRLGMGFGLILTFLERGFEVEAVSRRRTALEPPVWLWLTPDSTVTLVLSKAEMGQGVYTSLAMAAVEELDLPWEQLRLEAAPAAAGYRDPVWHRQITGGSSSTSHLHEVFRLLGATARQMLLTAAARQWQVDPETCTIRDGVIRHLASGRRVVFGEVCEPAAGLPVPREPRLKSPDELRLVGAGQPRLDLPAKLNGTAAFGLDHFTVPMWHAVIARPPAYGAEILTMNSGATASLPGVRRVIRLDQGVAVLADSPAAALQGRERLAITWSPGADPELSDASLEALFSARLEAPGIVATETGQGAEALAACPRSLTVTYHLPYLAHATLEPMNCLADVRPESCRVWAPLQHQSQALETVQELTGLPPENIFIQTTLLGGGFGRRLEVDFVAQAVRLSQAAGQPVKLFWTREDDFQYDFFRPMTATRIRAGLDAQGRLQVWDHVIAAPSIHARTSPRALRQGIDPAAVEGLRPFPYTVPHLRLTYVRVDTPVPVGPWRSVGHSHNAFGIEAGMDELAHLAGADPLEFRLAHLPPDSRAARVLQAAADRAGWGRSLPPGRGLGLAQHACFGSFVAQVAEVSVAEGSGRLTVDRVVAAVDCGAVVNPETVAAQMEGGILFGLSAALREQVHFAGGGVSTRNFTDYRLLSLAETPAIDVVLVDRGNPRGGVGEPGVPPIAPAVANAIFAATGRRVQRLPLVGGEK